MTTLQLQVPHDHPAYAGHFPGRPILPGVVLLDLCARALQAAHGSTVTGVAQAKFLSPLTPGEALWLDYELAPPAAAFTLRSGDRRIASGRFTLQPPEVP